VYPILEFDDNPQAVIMPMAEPLSPPQTDCCVLCFSHQVVSRVAEESSATLIAESPTVAGPVPLYEADFNGKRTAFSIGGVGGPLSAALLEKAIALGYKRFVACGSCGVIDSAIPSGHLLVPVAAVRDEGTSYHYAPPSDRIEAQDEPIRALDEFLSKAGVPFDKVTTWTTDAFFRETRKRVARRREQGCAVVEMEAAPLFAVAQFRSVQLGMILYAGDDVGGETWDRRKWQIADGDTQTHVFELAVAAVHEIEVT
jgi:uridine phosphorylase